MKTVPVLLNFDASEVIGTLQVDEAKLPPGHGYVFAIGYIVGNEDSDDKLYSVSLQTDEQYLAYLESDQKAETDRLIARARKERQ